MKTSDSTRAAVKLLGAYTAGQFTLWSLAGPRRASCRAHVMGALHGKKMPQSQSGVTAIRAEFYARLPVSGDCEALREDSFIAICRELAAETI